MSTAGLAPYACWSSDDRKEPYHNLGSDIINSPCGNKPIVYLESAHIRDLGQSAKVRDVLKVNQFVLEILIFVDSA